MLGAQDLGKGEKLISRTEPVKEGRGQIIKVLVKSIKCQDTTPWKKQSGEKTEITEER